MALLLSISRVAEVQTTHSFTLPFFLFASLHYRIIGSGKVDMGAKAMIHTIAGKARGFPIKSVGTMMDEVRIRGEDRRETRVLQSMLLADVTFSPRIVC